MAEVPEREPFFWWPLRLPSPPAVASLLADFGRLPLAERPPSRVGDAAPAAESALSAFSFFLPKMAIAVWWWYALRSGHRECNGGSARD